MHRNSDQFIINDYGPLSSVTIILQDLLENPENEDDPQLP